MSPTAAPPPASPRARPRGRDSAPDTIEGEARADLRDPQLHDVVEHRRDLGCREPAVLGRHQRGEDARREPSQTGIREGAAEMLDDVMELRVAQASARLAPGGVRRRVAATGAGTRAGRRRGCGRRHA